MAARVLDRLPRMSGRGLAVCTDVSLVFSPERVDPGNRQYPIKKIPKVVGGVTDACRAAGEALYGSLVERTVPVSSPRAAERAKLLENIYRFVNIGLMNELKVVADKKNIDDPLESPALELMGRFQGKGAAVSYSDPHIPAAPPMRQYDFDKQQLTSVDLTPDSLAAAEAVVLATDHDRFDYGLIAAHAQLVIDTRGRYLQPLPNVVRC